MSRVPPEPGFVYKNHHNVQPGRVVTPDSRKTYLTLVQTDSIGLGAWVDPLQARCRTRGDPRELPVDGAVGARVLLLAGHP